MSSKSTPIVLPRRTSSVRNQSNQVPKTPSEDSFQARVSIDSQYGRGNTLDYRNNENSYEYDRSNDFQKRNSQSDFATSFSKIDIQDRNSNSESTTTTTTSTTPPGKIKIKIYENLNDIRIMLVPQEILYSELIEKIRSKLKNPCIFCKFLDESGRKTVMSNDDDLDEAIEYARVPNRLELWTFTNK
jgi:hypothetical protein